MEVICEGAAKHHLNITIRYVRKYISILIFKKELSIHTYIFQKLLYFFFKNTQKKKGKKEKKSSTQKLAADPRWRR